MKKRTVGPGGPEGPWGPLGPCSPCEKTKKTNFSAKIGNAKTLLGIKMNNQKADYYFILSTQKQFGTKENNDNRHYKINVQFLLSLQLFHAFLFRQHFPRSKGNYIMSHKRKYYETTMQFKVQTRKKDLLHVTSRD